MLDWPEKLPILASHRYWYYWKIRRKRTELEVSDLGALQMKPCCPLPFVQLSYSMSAFADTDTDSGSESENECAKED